MAASMSTLAERLKSRRLALRLTRKALAARAGVTTEHLRYVESGRIQTPHTIRPLAEALRCDPLWLAAGIDPAAGLTTCGALGDDERSSPRRIREYVLFGAGVVVGAAVVVALWLV